MSKNRTYTNGTITVVWRPEECIHSAVCFTNLRAVFNPIRRPWINMEGAGTEEIIAIVEKCPSEALTFFWNDDAKNRESKSPKLFDKSKLSVYFKGQEPAEDHSTGPEPDGQTAGSVVVTYKPGNPLMIKGAFQLVNEAGETTEMKAAAICRCGLSAKQPFCDGAHIKAKFDK